MKRVTLHANALFRKRAKISHRINSYCSIWENMALYNFLLFHLSRYVKNSGFVLHRGCQRPWNNKSTRAFIFFSMFGTRDEALVLVFDIITSLAALQGTPNWLNEILDKELSGKAWWNLNDPELEWHIFCNAKKARILHCLKINSIFRTITCSTVYFELWSLDKRGTSYWMENYVENYLKGNETCFELAGGSSYRGSEVLRVKLQ